ncbi:MAG: rod shape-determining protein MreD [Candidatus Eisenbacteria bacterium]
MKADHISRTISEVVYVGIAFVLQSSIAGYVAIGAARPDLILGSLVYVSLSRRPLESTIFGFLVGLLQDLSFGGGFGLNSFCKCLTCFCVSYSSSRLFKERYWTQVIVIAVSVLFHDFVYFAFVFPGKFVAVAQSILRVSLGSGLYTALVSPGYDYLMSRVFYRREEATRETTVVPPEQ